MTSDLHEVVRERADVTLFRGAGPAAAGAVSLRTLRRTSPLLAPLGADQATAAELAQYALRLWPHLARGRYDVVHCIEPYLLNCLAALRRRRAFGATLVLTDGLGLTAASARRADILHVTTPLALAAVVADGRDASTVHCVPTGIDAAAFAPPCPRDEARRRLGLPQAGQVLLGVAAVNRRHKRVDALVREVAALPGEPTLVVVGAPEEREILDLGTQLLGSRFVHAYVAPSELPLWYAAADVFVHAALIEGYGLSILEAMAAGLPVVVHRSEHFEWLVGDVRQLVDESEPGWLGRALADLPPDFAEANRSRVAEVDWRQLAGQYVELYERARSLARSSAYQSR